MRSANDEYYFVRVQKYEDYTQVVRADSVESAKQKVVDCSGGVVEITDKMSVEMIDKKNRYAALAFMIHFNKISDDDSKMEYILWQFLKRRA